jgi:hypothetical protein
MYCELVQLNKVYKCNQFTIIRPKVFDDMIVFHIDRDLANKKGADPVKICINL